MEAMAALDKTAEEVILINNNENMFVLHVCNFGIFDLGYYLRKEEPPSVSGGAIATGAVLGGLVGTLFGGPFGTSFGAKVGTAIAGAAAGTYMVNIFSQFHCSNFVRHFNSTNCRVQKIPSYLK